MNSQNARSEPGSQTLHAERPGDREDQHAGRGVQQQVGETIINTAGFEGLRVAAGPAVPRRMTEFENRVSEMLIDLVGSTSDEDLAKNADLSKDRVKEIMDLINEVIAKRRKNNGSEGRERGN